MNISLMCGQLRRKAKVGIIKREIKLSELNKTMQRITDRNIRS